MTSSHKTFKKAAGLMLVAVLASRLLGLVREMLIARQFGQTGAVSAYTAAFNLPDLLYFFLSSGALSSAFIPVFTERFKTGRQKEAWQIFSIIACFMGLVLTAAIVLAWIYARPLASLFSVPGFVEGDPKLVQLTVFLTRIILPCQLFFFLGGLMMATLESRQKFSARAAGPVIYNIGIILGAIFLARWFHIAGLAIGTLIGAFAGNIAYTYYCMRKEGFELYPSLNIRHPGVLRVAALGLPVILGLGLPQIDIIVNKWFASFVSVDAPAALNYANRLMQVPLGIFAQAAGTAILPMLAAYAAQNALDDMRSGLAYGLRAIMVESIPATFFIIVMADPLVRTIYMGGKFGPGSVPDTVTPLIWYSVGIFAWAGQAIVARGFFAMQDTATPVVIGTVATIVFIPLNYVLMRTMGAGGIALATTIAISLHFLAMTWFLRKRLHGLECGRTLSTIGRITAAAAVMAVACVGVRVGMARLVGSWQIQDGDIRQPTELALTLREGNTPLSSYLYSELSPGTKDLVATQEAADSLAPRLRDSLVLEMNAVMRDPSLYNDSRFARVTLSKRTRALAEAPPHGGSSLLHLNRALLEAAYPDTIVKVADVSAVDRLLRGSSKRGGGDSPGWLLRESDIRSLPDLAAELLDAKSRVSAYVVSQLPNSTRSMLKTYSDKQGAALALPQSLAHDLNRVINSDELYPPERFGSAHGLALARRHPTGRALAEANRRLLEAAYPDQIVKRPFYRIEGKLTSAITVLVAMLVGAIVYLPLLKLFGVDELDYLWSALRRRLSRRPNGQQGGSPGTVEPFD